MRKLITALACCALLQNFAQTGETVANKVTKPLEEIRVGIDIANVKDDKVTVTMEVPKIAGNKVTFHLPSIIPGTYSKDDYGKFIDNVRAYGKTGKELAVAKNGANSWDISNANGLAKITYQVNDSYDKQGEGGVFSPAGTNIADKTNFMLNLHGFVGYFADMQDHPYEITVTHPAALWGATSLVDLDASDTKDVFKASRYFEITDSPIMYSKPDYTTFMVGDMEIIFSVYSPNGSFNAKMLSPDIEKMMRAQKRFLGDINKNKRYTILLYLTDVAKDDANGFGALEHNTSTTVVFPEMMPKDQLVTGLIDVISHEFFHTVTPLAIHSKEIHNFDYTTPKMSEHLWLYEGVTEYFANLFQVNQGLIDEDEFYLRMAGKIKNAASYNDTMSFTEMSRNVINPPYKAQYNNVYEKGALIAMCIDIIIREKTGGERGILDLMHKLSSEYGPDKPFDDSELFAKIVSLTFAEVGDFLNRHVSGTTPIPYDLYFAKVGISKAVRKVPTNPFLKNQTTPYITIKPGGKEIVVINGIKLNNFLNAMKLQGGDVIEQINGTAYNLDNIYEMIMGAQAWKEGESVTLKIKRDGKEMTLSGKVVLDYSDAKGYVPTDHSKDNLREAWLKK